MGVLGKICNQVHNKNHWTPPVCWKQTTICISKRQYMVKAISLAIQQIELLRRCFFPLRDVIRWRLFEIRASRPWRLALDC
jgi:hypothetical protein